MIGGEGAREVGEKIVAGQAQGGASVPGGGGRRGFRDRHGRASARGPG